MKNNKEILVIPKHKLPFDDGVTVDRSNLWNKYNNHMLFRSLTSDNKLFYKIIPYLIIEYSGHYLVFNTGDDHYSFNSKGLVYIQDCVHRYNYIRPLVDYNAEQCGLQDIRAIKDFGFIKAQRTNPDDIAIVYRAKINTFFEAPDNAKWMDYNDLVNKCRKFDGFGIEFINYLIDKII